MSTSRPLLSLLFGAWACLLPAGAAARPRLDLMQQYEEELIRWALAEEHLEREPQPQGKIIERIVIAREKIIAASDPWPNFLNWFHLKTKERVVRQEMLVSEGELWDEARVAESARNLRSLFVLAVVRTVPCKSARPGHVILLVATKDLWSIRLNTIFSQVGPVLQQFESFPTEQNFLGRNKQVSLHLRLDQFNWERGRLQDGFAVGQIYIDPRVLGSHWRVTEWFDLLFAGDVPCGGANGAQSDVWCPKKRFGELEGVYAQLRVRRPLFALNTKWGMDTWATVDIGQRRRYRYNSGPTSPRGESLGLSLRSDLYSDNDASPAVPRVYDARLFAGSTSYTRSFGSATKYNLTGGVTGYSYRYTHPEGLPFSPEVLAWHAARFLPRSEEALMLFAAGRTYSPRYVRLRDIQGFALSEDFTLGHSAALELQGAANLQDPAQSYLAVALSMQYRWYLLDDMLTVWLSSYSRLQPGLDERGLGLETFEGPWVNSGLQLGLKNISPPFWWGRLHLRVLVQYGQGDGASETAGVPRTLAPSRIRLGGDSGLRGYPSEQFEGDNLFQVNAEYRSVPLNLLTLHLGLVLFYDGGAVFGGADPLDAQAELPFRYHHSVGVGIRGHFPQFDKESLRVDFAVPLTEEHGSPSTWFSLSFKQVF